MGMGLGDGRARVSTVARDRSRFGLDLRTESRLGKSLVFALPDDNEADAGVVPDGTAGDDVGSARSRQQRASRLVLPVDARIRSRDRAAEESDRTRSDVPGTAVVSGPRLRADAELR